MKDFRRGMPGSERPCDSDVRYYHLPHHGYMGDHMYHMNNGSATTCIWWSSSYIECICDVIQERKCMESTLSRNRDDAGKTAIIVQAWYRLKSVVASFSAHLAQCMQEMRYESCNTNLGLSWKPEIRSQDKCEHYLYILCYVDDTLCVHHDPENVLEKCIDYVHWSLVHFVVPRYKVKANAAAQWHLDMIYDCICS